MWKRIRTLSLRNKLIVSITICLLFPTLVSNYTSNWLTRDVVRKQVTAQRGDSLKVVKQYLENQMNHMVFILNLLQFDDDLHMAVTELGILDARTEPNETAILINLINKRLETSLNAFGSMYVTILLPNQDYYASYKTFKLQPIDLFQRPWYKAAAELSTYKVAWIGVEPNTFLEEVQQDSYLLSIAKPIKTGSVLRGVAVVSIESSELHNILSHSNETETLIIDDSGKVVMDRDERKIGTVFPYLKQLPPEGESSLVQMQGEQFIMLSEKLGTEWHVVSLSSFKHASGPIEAIRELDTVIQLCFLVLFAGLLFYLTGAITKPISRLMQTVIRVEQGHLEKRSGIRGEDEVGRLGYVFDRMLDRIEEMLVRIVGEQEKKRMAELAMLQAQINPHFLFNILNSIRMRILLRGDKENAEIISSLSSLLRMTINRNNEFITLHEEIETNRHYVLLVNSRHGNTLSLVMKVASDALLTEVPRLILQPLIENAYLHGLPKGEGTIEIMAHLIENGRLKIVVSDTGGGIPSDKLKQLSQHVYGLGEETTSESSHKGLSGIGIRNVYERISLLYREQCEFTISSEIGIGTSITLVIPVLQKEG
jgi:two-component system, sensor histidine kinase YesM